MPRKLRYADEAVADLAAIAQWQTQLGSGAAGARRVRIIRAAIRRLKQNPCLYARGANPGTRELPCEGHRVVYAVEPDAGDNATAGDVACWPYSGQGRRDGTFLGT